LKERTPVKKGGGDLSKLVLFGNPSEAAKSTPEQKRDL